MELKINTVFKTIDKIKSPYFKVNFECFHVSFR